jgi:hypothetical protein
MIIFIRNVGLWELAMRSQKINDFKKATDL